MAAEQPVIRLNNLTRSMQRRLLLDITEPSITYIDDYAPECYGLEIPERLLHEAYVMRQNCTRKPGEYETGRPSQPAYQDMNMASLRNDDDVNRRTVLFSAGEGDPLNPFELLMAYEEHGHVKPVVSDFDCFLVGSRRVQFQSPLPESQ